MIKVIRYLSIYMFVLANCIFATHAQNNNTNSYIVQLGVYQQINYAALDVFNDFGNLLKVEGGDQNTFKVFIGAIEDRQTAESVLNTVRQRGYVDAFIAAYQPTNIENANTVFQSNQQIGGDLPLTQPLLENNSPPQKHNTTTTSGSLLDVEDVFMQQQNQQQRSLPQNLTAPDVPTGQIDLDTDRDTGYSNNPPPNDSEVMPTANENGTEPPPVDKKCIECQLAMPLHLVQLGTYKAIDKEEFMDVFQYGFVYAGYMGSLYNVLVGPFYSKKEAEEVAKIAQTLGYKSAFLQTVFYDAGLFNRDEMTKLVKESNNLMGFKKLF